MVDETQCKSVGKVVFSAQTQQMKPALIVTVFGVPITEKFKLARSMIKSYVNKKYSVADFKIASIEKAEWKIVSFKVCLCGLFFIFMKRKPFKIHEHDFYFIKKALFVL